MFSKIYYVNNYKLKNSTLVDKDAWSEKASNIFADRSVQCSSGQVRCDPFGCFFWSFSKILSTQVWRSFLATLLAIIVYNIPTYWLPSVSLVFKRAERFHYSLATIQLKNIVSGKTACNNNKTDYRCPS